MVPEGMLKAALAANPPKDKYAMSFENVIEAALLWQRDNAPVPTGRQIQEMSDGMNAQGDHYHSTETYCADWIRRMYDAPEPDPMFEQKEVFFNKPGDYYVHVPANGKAPEFGPIESFVRGRSAQPSEPEVPPHIKDLMERTADLPPQQIADIKGVIVAAYRRGRESE